ncbi:hypothetical protein DUNSADRAFT_16987 [Dunaliella salina]|uniref:Uncharacterized protein n=1 Tax=Dunaliella salina TaxID=3046 RepID=A0ABQ7G2N2_DUNSA|nr:hypothetical protein DUNSADRAFT_16987 [Dunaliella salina]|eukprot:KAF5828851.1 hypothetical protein DUNSADRAFT_16987 [Dunaliella salina]
MSSKIAPSTLSYRDRLHLAQNDSFAYKQLYSHGSQKDVFARLTGDASGRIERLNETNSSMSSTGSPRSMDSADSDIPWPEMSPTSNAFYSQGTLSGFMSNTSKPGTSTASIRSSRNNLDAHVPLDKLPEKLEKRFKQQNPLEYMATLRPQAETTNQTLRMMGTYASDFQNKRAGMQTVHMAPGGPAGFHPDVKA